MKEEEKRKRCENIRSRAAKDKDSEICSIGLCIWILGIWVLLLDFVYDSIGNYKMIVGSYISELMNSIYHNKQVFFGP